MKRKKKYYVIYKKDGKVYISEYTPTEFIRAAQKKEFGDNPIFLSQFCIKNINNWQNNECLIIKGRIKY